MRFIFNGKNISIYDDVKERTEKKLSRLQKLVSDDAEVFIAISKHRHQYKMEVSVPLHKRMLRAEVTAGDINACTDSVADILEKQIRRYKSRLRERSRRNVATAEETSFAQELAHEAQVEAHDSGSDIVIHRTKRFALKPMDATEAIMEMELLNHSFFVFRNAETDDTNVVYKRNDGEYGLIESE
ncbi:MAG: ribosome-associated translation inhibitor RaiA [Turicibacter sp.]|nr:ribosome-associated translation inhibitor RaiA [Turicibacter sp.]